MSSTCWSPSAGVRTHKKSERPAKLERPEPIPKAPVSTFGSGLAGEQRERQPRERDLPERDLPERDLPEHETLEPDTPEPTAADQAEPDTTLSVQEDEPGVGFGAGLS